MLSNQDWPAHTQMSFLQNDSTHFTAQQKLLKPDSSNKNVEEIEEINEKKQQRNNNKDAAFYLIEDNMSSTTKNGENNVQKESIIKNQELEQSRKEETQLLTLRTPTSLKKVPSNRSSTRKQIQFNFENPNQASSTEGDASVKANQQQPQQPQLLHRNNSFKIKALKASSSLHETLNRLKTDELKRRNNRKPSSASKAKSKKVKKKLSLKELAESMEKLQKNMFQFLERPVGVWGFVYRMFTFTIILGSILIGAITTVHKYEKVLTNFLYLYEIFVTFYFSIDYALRVWSSGHLTKYRSITGRIKFMLTPLLVIEAVLILINVINLSFFTSFKYLNEEIVINVSALTAMRFFQLIRFLYIDRQAQTWNILIKVIYKHRFELLSSFYIGIIILLFSSYFIMLVEKDYSDQVEDNHFHSYADAIYWSIITMTTIGYGDRAPRTFIGKIIATTLCIVGVAFWTLPGGIIGSGFALKVEQRNKQKQFNRLVPAAAQLIQAWWRMKATIFISASNVSCMTATVATFDISKPIYSSSLRRFKRNYLDSASAYDELNSFFYGIDPPANRNQNQLGVDSDQPTTSAGGETPDNLDTITTNVDGTNMETSPLTTDSNPRQFKKNNSSSHSSTGTTQEPENTVLLKLTPEHLLLIRTILLLKFFVARRKFKLAYKPYDFKDVIEQYTQGNLDMSVKLKDLQRKLEQLTLIIYSNRFADITGTGSPYTSVSQGQATGNNSASIYQNPHRSRSPPAHTRNYSFNASGYSPTNPVSPPSPSLISVNNMPRPLSHEPSNYNICRIPGQRNNSLRVRSITNDFNFPSTSPLSPQTAQSSILVNDSLNDRIGHLEEELSNLSTKLDKLIELSGNNN